MHRTGIAGGNGKYVCCLSWPKRHTVYCKQSAWPHKIICRHHYIVGYQVQSQNYFDTIKVRCRYTKDSLITQTNVAKINLRIYDDEYVGIWFDETTTIADVNNLVKIFAAANQSKAKVVGEDGIGNVAYKAWSAPVHL